MSYKGGSKLPDEQIKEDLKRLKEGNYKSEKIVTINKSRQHFIRIPSEMAKHFEIEQGQQAKLSWDANNKTEARIEFIKDEET
jgi:hypothetical protein